jgi:transposase-like protein
MSKVVGFYKKNGKTRPITRKAYRKNIMPDYFKWPLTGEKYTKDGLPIKYYSADGYSLVDALTSFLSKAHLLFSGDGKTRVEWHVGNQKVEYLNSVEERGHGTFKATVYKNGVPYRIFGAAFEKETPVPEYHNKYSWHVDAKVKKVAKKVD